MHEVYMSSDEETMTSATLSTVAPGESRRDSATDTDMDSGSGDEVFRQFHAGIKSATDNISTCKSTYFFDGGKRFISVSKCANDKETDCFCKYAFVDVFNCVLLTSAAYFGKFEY